MSEAVTYAGVARHTALQLKTSSLAAVIVQRPPVGEPATTASDRTGLFSLTETCPAPSDLSLIDSAKRLVSICIPPANDKNKLYLAPLVPAAEFAAAPAVLSEVRARGARLRRISAQMMLPCSRSISRKRGIVASKLSVSGLAV